MVSLFDFLFKKKKKPEEVIQVVKREHIAETGLVQSIVSPTGNIVKIYEDGTVKVVRGETKPGQRDYVTYTGVKDIQMGADGVYLYFEGGLVKRV